MPARRRLALTWAAHGLDEQGRQLWERIDRRWDWLHSREELPPFGPAPRPGLAVVNQGLPA